MKAKTLLLGLALLLAAPVGAQAALTSSVSWVYVDPAGNARDDAPYIFSDGGTVALPFNATGFAEIAIDLDPFYSPDGEIFFINPDTGERELAGYASEITWMTPGAYEMDVYQYVVAPSLSPWERFLAFLLPTAHAAPPSWEFIETIRFTVVEGELPPSPCCSSVLFLPGIEGSALKEGDDVLWPSSIFSNDVARLALTDEGESVNDVHVAGVLSDFTPGTDLYGGFATFMNDLSEDDGGDGTIRDWVPFGYDWRLSLQRTVDEGAYWESEDRMVSLVETVENLASESKTGKVTIVAHSMGGLVGKALIQKLEELEEAELIDSFIMVGTPQLGTPEAVAALLHGHQPMEMNLFIRSHVFRSVARNMGSAHALLPSEAYFGVSGIPDPITFNTSADFTAPWRAQWGESINTPVELTEFLTGTGASRARPSETNLAQPEVLREEVVADVAAFHDRLDSYEFPSSIRVVQVAGWGLPTMESIEYKKKHLIFDGYEPRFTIEGDQTVVYASALTNASNEQYYFNLATYNALDNQADRQHRDLTSAGPVQSVVESVLKGIDVSNTYIRLSKPDPGEVGDQLMISTKSPVVLGVFDNEGNFTGINSDQNLNAEVLEITEDIPGSVFIASGEDQFIFLPKEGSYTFKLKGTESGPTTVETSTFVGDEATLIATYTDIPTTPETSATFTVNSETPEQAIIEVDQNSDGVPDTIVAPDGYVPPPTEPTIASLIATLETKIQSLAIKPKLKTNLLKRIDKLEQKLEKQKQKKSRVLENLEAAIAKKAGKGKIDAISAAELTALLDELEAHAADFPLDSMLVQELREKIQALTIAPKLKANLLKRVDRLEKITGFLHSLERITKTITLKGAQGAIPDADAQELLSLLEQIEGTL